MNTDSSPRNIHFCLYRLRHTRACGYPCFLLPSNVSCYQSKINTVTVKNVCSLDSAKRQSGYSKLLIDVDGYQIVRSSLLVWRRCRYSRWESCKITLYEYLIVLFDKHISSMTVVLFITRIVQLNSTSSYSRMRVSIFCRLSNISCYQCMINTESEKTYLVWIELSGNRVYSKLLIDVDGYQIVRSSLLVWR